MVVNIFSIRLNLQKVCGLLKHLDLSNPHGVQHENEFVRNMINSIVQEGGGHPLYIERRIILIQRGLWHSCYSYVCYALHDV